MNIYLGLPAYNEEASIEPLFARIKKLQASFSYKIFAMIYDDGCTDNTKQEVLKCKDSLEIIYLDGVVNKGLGAGMNTLLREFRKIGQGDDILIVMDCDDTHDPAQIPTMVKVFEKYPKTDLVVGSRYRMGATISGVPLHRILLSIAAAMAYKVIHPISGVRDYTCGYRAYRYCAVTRAFSMFGEPLLKEKGFACMVEVLLKMARSGAKVREIPMALAYDNKLSVSKMDVTGNATRLLKKLLAWRVEGLQ